MMIFLFAALLLIGIFGALKNLRKKYYKDVALNERSPDFERKIRELAKVLSTPEPAGKGFDVAPVKSQIKKATKSFPKRSGKKGNCILLKNGFTKTTRFLSKLL